VKRFLAWFGLAIFICVCTFWQWSERTAAANRLSAADGVELRITSGAVEVVGGKGSQVRVEIEDVSPALAETAKIQIHPDRKPVLVEISNLPQKARAVVEVPASSSLAVSMLAGELKISGVTGNTFALLRSGQMTIGVGASSNFRSADGFVLAGNLDAAPFARETGGLWRTLHWSGPGSSRVDAHVTFGELILE
jgi:hypothetical protein